MIHRALAVGRQFILLAVVCSFLSSLAVMIYGFLQMGNSIFHAIADGGVSSDGAKQLVVSLIEVIDLFLLGTVFYITALGLYELFIDDRIKVPEWLEIHTIDDLKGKLISVIVVVLGVLFLGKAVTWNASSDLLTFGGSIALVIASLTYFLSWAKQKG